jgi:hypothetical protein
MTKKQTLEREYRKARHALVERIRYYKKKTGVNVNYLLPKKPKKITEGSIRRLQRIDSKKIKKEIAKVKKKDVLKYSELFKLIESNLRVMTEGVVAWARNLPDKMGEFIRGESIPTFWKWFNNEIDKYTGPQFAEIIEPKLNAFYDSAYNVMTSYGELQLSRAMDSLTSLVYGRPLSVSESVAVNQSLDYVEGGWNDEEI